MIRLPIHLFILLFTVLVAAGCSDSNSQAPNVDDVHPQTWVIAHAAEARERLVDCTVCHGDAFQGSGEAVSCFACHFVGPPQFAQFQVHPPEWGENVVAGHQTFPQSYSWTTCANAACHGTELRSGITGPSCFLAQCHAEGPPAPHGELFFVPQDHGPVALNQQFFCRNCHGRPPNVFDGGFVSDPQITNELRGNCSLSFCHPAAMAHPTNWQGDNDPDPTYAASHRGVGAAAVDVSCALCHLTTGPGTGAVAAAPSCFSAQFTNADGSTTVCHPGGPRPAPHPVGQEWLLPSAHAAQALQQPTFCADCHITGGVQPLCTSCHTAANPLEVSSGCASCHTPPPSGDVRPNRAGRHNIPQHLVAFAELFNDCQNCHFGAGSGSLQHFDRTGTGATEAIPPAEVNLNTSQLLFNFNYDPAAATCSNVLCHQPAAEVRNWYP